MAKNKVEIKLVRRKDESANWTAKNPILLAGEPGYETDTGLLKRGDGVSNWLDLDYINDASTAAHYEGTAQEGESDTDVIDRVMTGKTPKTDDIFIVKRTISGAKISYTAYVYSGSNWSAMDGNYDASNVYFDSDLTATAPIGVITIPGSGSTKINAAGLSVKQVLSSILAKEKNPSVTNPSVNLTAPQQRAYEVGTKITPTYNASLNPGSYEFGPATGITAQTWSVTDGTETKTTASGSFAELTVGDATNYGITATATYNEGAIPVTNLGNAYEGGKIVAGSASKTSSKITGYRSFFYGVLNTSSADQPLDSAVIRSLTNGGNYNSSKTLNLAANAVSGAKRVVVATVASGRAGLQKVIMPSAMNADATADFKQKSNVEVEGLNGASSVPYKVWVYEPAAIDPSETYQITLA